MQTRKRWMGRKTRRRKRGGAPIAAGGFGCVFRPPIRCSISGPSMPYDETGVSKLMTRKHANLEMAGGKAGCQLCTHKIPHAQRYFSTRWDNDLYSRNPYRGGQERV